MGRFDRQAIDLDVPFLDQALNGATRDRLKNRP